MGSGFRVKGVGLRFQGLRVLWVQGSGFRVKGVGLRF